MDTPAGHEEIEAALERTAAGILPTAATVLACVYAALAVGHALTLEPGVRETLTLLATGTAITCALVAFSDVGRRLPGARAVSGMIGLGVWLNVSVHMLLAPHPELAMNFAVMNVGLGFFVADRRWFYGLLTLSLITWLAAVLLHSLPATTESWQIAFSAVIAVLGHEQRRGAVATALDRERELRNHAAELRRLTHARELTRGSGAGLYELLLASAARTLDVARVSIWRSDEDRTAIECIAVQDELGPGAEGLVRRIELEDAQAYFTALSTERTISADDAATDPTFAQLRERYLTPLGIDALLDAPILVDGSARGVLCLEHRGGPRHWRLEEQSFAASLAGLAALALEAEARNELERRTQTAERLESLGLLAGGVAHDFNNLLTAVLGNAELGRARLAPEDPLRDNLDGILDAATRATDLARQMLAYAGRATFATNAVDMDELVRSVAEAWPVGNPRAVRIERDFDPTIPLASAEPLRVTQIVLNLLDNAVEAGATAVALRTGTTELDAQALRHCVIQDGVQHGPHVFIEVEDDGCGMDDVTANRIFEPFFTTKRVGHGLGLSAALGTMRMHRGSIELDTRPGCGTRIRFLFPVSDGVERIAVPSTPREKEESAMDAARSTREPGTGDRTGVAADILVVEDEPLVRSLLGTILKKAGHRMDAIDDCAHFAQRLDVIDLAEFSAAMVDLTLPDGDGIDVVRQLRQKRSDLPVVVMSGYDGSQALARLGNADRVEFLSKPFTRRQLLDCLDTVTA